MSQANLGQSTKETSQNLITIKINNQALQCEEGDSIIEVARANGIFIPTICYLSGCSPTLACKMCMGENVEGKRVYTCNTKAKDGLEIFTDTPSIRRERQMIMQTYDVNHPLECGVCDKSGECELQNLTLYTKVSHQDFALPDDEKHSKFWAQAEYDPNLCIVCERCVTTCKDNIGEAKLKANKAELHSPDEYKDKMEKDPYSVWSKKQKSLIEFVGETPCLDCGECIAVCPVGALTYKDFSYTANAWELKSIPSTCTHCAAGCQVIYEKRHCDIEGKSKIYRVKNDFHFAPICGAARFGFGLHSHFDESKEAIGTHSSEVLENALEALQKAKSIHIGSQATNEEALITQNLATHFGLKIHNAEAYAYQRLLGNLPLNHSLQELKSSSVIIALGASVRLHIPQLQYAINNTIRIQKGVKFFYVNPIFDTLLASFSRSVESISYGADCEGEALLGLLFALQEACKADKDDKESAYKDFGVKFANEIANENDSVAGEVANALKHIKSTQQEIQINKEQDKQESSTDSTQTQQESGIESSTPPNTQSSSPKIIYQALQEAGIELDDFAKIANALLGTLSSEKSSFCGASLVVGSEVLNAILRESREQSSLIVEILSLLEKFGLKVFVIPNGANVAGIARICTLEAPQTTNALKNSIGIRANGEWVWDSYLCDDEGNIAQYRDKDTDDKDAKPHLILPSFSQMNASITNYESRVLPINRVLDFAGFDLSDIAKFVASKDREFALSYAVCENLAGYILELPKDKGYQAILHSSLKNHYTQSGEDKRGYALESISDFSDLKRVFSSDLSSTQEARAKSKNPQNAKSKKISKFNAYLSFPQNLFDTQTVLDKNMQQQDGFYTSREYFEELGLKEGEEICLIIKSIDETQDFGKIKARAYIDYGLSQKIWLISPYIFSREVLAGGIFTEEISSNYLSATLIK